ncbi:MAG: DUF3553 domain-containing protein [Phycisphaeraceae bacterium]
MKSPPRYQRGDVVYHARRPEWGQGVVRNASSITHQGQSAQRLAVDFSHRGRMTLNTAVAPLTTRQEDRTTMNPAGRSTTAGGGWLAELERATNNSSHELWNLPEALTDPFASPAKRLEATLDTYRFDTSPRSLIEWAVMQTGLEDPLSKYTRPELEQAFPRFARDRDAHLQQLVRQLKRSDRSRLDAILQQTRQPAAKNALSKAMRR